MLLTLSPVFMILTSAPKLPEVWKSALVLPLPEGGERSIVYDYRLISNLCIMHS